MPYLILTSQAKLVNTYVCGPIVVGDKSVDPKLMKAVGAKLVTNYPACGSPPLYLVHSDPRTILDQLEKFGFKLFSTSVGGDKNDCIVWVLYSESGYEDPNTKGSQTGDSENEKKESNDEKKEVKKEPDDTKKSLKTNKRPY